MINPLQLAERQEGLTGTVPLSALPRIRDLLHDAKGSVNFKLEFGKDEQGVVYVLGEFSAKLKVKCQRCMQPMDLPLQGKIRLGVVNTKVTQDFPDRYEPLTLSDGETSVEALLEEEIILALPIAPVHDRGHCRDQGLLEAYRPQHKSPFAVLKNLKLDK